jgi:HEAT repeat protein
MIPRAALLLALVLGGCVAKARNQMAPADDEQIDRWIGALLQPRAGAGYNQLRAEALAHLRAHPERCHPRLLALADVPDPPVVILSALPEFASPDSVPVLARALREAEDSTTVVAAQALARHPAPAAFDALIEALGSARAQVVASAASGLGDRGDPRARAPLERALAHPEPEVRERIRQVLARLP